MTEIEGGYRLVRSGETAVATLRSDVEVLLITVSPIYCKEGFIKINNTMDIIYSTGNQQEQLNPN